MVMERAEPRGGLCWLVILQARALIDSSILQSAKSPGRTRCGELFGGVKLWEWLFVESVCFFV